MHWCVGCTLLGTHPAVTGGTPLVSDAPGTIEAVVGRLCALFGLTQAAKFQSL